LAHRLLGTQEARSGERGEVQDAAEHRPGRGGDGAAYRPHPDRAAARPRLGEGLPDQRHRRGHHRRGSRALHEPGGDQLTQAGREPARDRRQDEHDHARGEGATCSDAVAQRAGRQQQRGEHQRVAVDDPLQPGHAAAQVGPDNRQGHVHHDGVQGHDEEPQHRRRQCEIRMTVPDRRAAAPS
jgi:hypothetical protein